MSEREFQLIERAAAGAGRLVDLASDGRLPDPVASELSRISTDMADLLVMHRRLEVEHRSVLRASRHDELTGLFSHAYFVERLGGEFRRTLRYSLPLALVLVGLDGVAELGKTRGRLVSNEVLRRAAEVIRRGTRETDVSARYGVQEFAILLPHTGWDQAAALAERLRAALVTLPGGIRPRLGIAVPDPATTRALDFLMDGERALSRAKAQKEEIPWIPGSSSSA